MKRSQKMAIVKYAVVTLDWQVTWMIKTRAANGAKVSAAVRDYCMGSLPSRGGKGVGRNHLADLRGQDVHQKNRVAAHHLL